MNTPPFAHSLSSATKIRCALCLGVAVTAFLFSSEAEANDLFVLVVDPAGPTPFFDATGRHEIVTGAVADIDPDPPVVPGSVIATNVMSPGGDNAALCTGGWIEMQTPNPAFASDFLFAADQDLTVFFWFRSAGNGKYDPTPSWGYDDRMHAFGLGSLDNNLDVDLGDEDPIAGLPETACWTYFGSDGDNNVVDSDGAHDRNYYLDDQWHFYKLVRSSGDVTVYIDGVALGTTSYTDSLGSDSPDARNYIGRASILTDSITMEDPFPWFGYIAGVRVYDEAFDCSVTTYCVETQNPNNAAGIASDTCESSSANVNISLSNGPPGQFCYLLVGDGNQTLSQPPGAKGDLCIVGGTCLGRYDKDIGQIDSAGTFSTDIKNALSNPCAGGVNIDPGTTWNFQYWHRQPMGQPATFSAALAVTFE